MANALVKTQKLKKLSNFEVNPMANSVAETKEEKTAEPAPVAQAAQPAAANGKSKDAYVKEKITLKELGDYGHERARNAKPYVHDPCKTEHDMEVTCDEVDDAIKRIKQDKFRQSIPNMHKIPNLPEHMG